MPITMGEESEWERSQSGDMPSCSGFLVFMVAALLLLAPGEPAPNTLPVQFHAQIQDSPCESIAYRPYKESDVCLLRHYDEWSRAGEQLPSLHPRQALSSPKALGSKDVVYSDRPVVIHQNKSDQGLTLSGEFEMWINGKNLVIMRNQEGDWQARRPALDSTVRMTLSIQSIDLLPPLNC
jgi:hypothetical protein